MVRTLQPSLTRAAFLAAIAAGALTRPIAQAHPGTAAHLPRRSDVIFSTRWARPEALATARAFVATRLDWCYTTDAAFLQAARQAGLGPLGAAVNANLPDRPGLRTHREGRIQDREGHPVTAPWMRAWGNAWGCANAPAYRAAWLAHATASLAAGADTLLMDDPGMNVAAVAWGGCWCPHCRAVAAAEGTDLGRDMAAFQRRSVTRFYADVRQALDQAAGRRVSLGCNNYRGSADWPAGLFDFGIAELPAGLAEPGHIATVLAAAEARGFPQAFTLVSEDVARNRQAAAWCYAQGGHMVVPWDVYLRSTPTGSDRFFARPEDVAPLFRMARALGALLDEARRGGPAEGAVRDPPPGLHWALRAPADGRFAVLHLVPWGQVAPLALRLDPERLPHQAGEVVVPDAAAIPLRRSGAELIAELPPAPWYAVVLRPV